MNALELESVRVSRGGRTLLDLPSFRVGEGEFFVLLGPSGSGKTTLLRVVAGLLSPDAGTVRLFGADCGRTPPHERPVGVVFQGLALWPHLSVRGNLALGLARHVPDPGERGRRIEGTAEELGIARFLDRKPARLSGGEKQRVALARALAARPRLLLLDEPFGGLDAPLRRSAARLVRDLHAKHGMTTLLITHDRADAWLLADRAGLLREGKLVAEGEPARLDRSPGSRFVAEFLTDVSLVRGTVVADGVAETALGRLLVPAGSAVGARLLLPVRPEELRIGSGDVRARVVACEFAGGPWRCRLRAGDLEIAALSEGPLATGSEVRLAPPESPRIPVTEEA